MTCKNGDQKFQLIFPVQAVGMCHIFYKHPLFSLALLATMSDSEIRENVRQLPLSEKLQVIRLVDEGNSKRDLFSSSCI